MCFRGGRRAQTPPPVFVGAGTRVADGCVLFEGAGGGCVWSGRVYLVGVRAFVLLWVVTGWRWPAWLGVGWGKRCGSGGEGEGWWSEGGGL